jgi:hypothetical protein
MRKKVREAVRKLFIKIVPIPGTLASLLVFYTDAV